MALALVIVSRSRGANVKLIAHGREFGDRFEPAGRWLDLDLGIELRAELGDHRVDFLLTLDGTLRHFGIHAASKRMVVECDGHDYHDLTKEQASRDRERDRSLQSFGFLVFRYTGRDIWVDVFKCASEAIDSLFQPVLEELSRGWQRARDDAEAVDESEDIGF